MKSFFGLPLVHIGTGGGCTALQATFGTFYFLVTDEDATAYREGGEWSVGLYSDAVEDYSMFSSPVAYWSPGCPPVVECRELFDRALAELGG